jgi:uncharacterized protein (DUF362 family)
VTRAKVAVLKTRPETVIEDYARLMRLAEFETFLPKSVPTILKVNISWQKYYPACSTVPWQLEGVARTLVESGYKDLIAGHNGTVVVDSHRGERNNRQRPVQDRYDMKTLHVTDPDTEWMRYEPKAKMLVLDKVYPKGIFIPRLFPGKNVVHLPTVKTHVFTTITGAMKNAFGGLLNYQRHWTHSVIHQTLVDLLSIQKEIHPGLFAVMDGTIAGDGPGPRAMRVYVKNFILASGDLVAIDAISAKMQGFDPLKLDFIRLAHEHGLGVGDPREIEVMGEDISEVDFRFQEGDTLASRGQKMIYHGILKPFEHILLRSPIVPWSYFASNVYYNLLWYPLVGRRRTNGMLKTEWGKLFLSYPLDSIQATREAPLGSKTAEEPLTLPLR